MFEKFEGKEKIPNLDLAYRKALDVLDKYRIKMSDFEEHYGKESIERDKSYVEKRETQFSVGEAQKKATVLEAIILEQIELSDYFGGNATSIPTSRYDDIANGVDGLIEFNQDNHFAYLGFSLDITFSHNLYDKFDRIKKEINTGLLTRIKYFKSDNNQDIIGAMRKIPRFVVGADDKQVKDLIKNWMNPNLKEKNEIFRKNEIQFNLLEQIMLQAEVFSRYARQGHNLEVANKMSGVLDIVKGIYEERKEALERDGIDTEHEVYKNIKEVLETRF